MCLVLGICTDKNRINIGGGGGGGGNPVSTKTPTRVVWSTGNNIIFKSGPKILTAVIIGTEKRQ